LGPYEILAPIGAGGMGEVYRAKDPRLGREVAIKVLPASLSQDADRLRRFEQEARSASALNHPNIITIHDIGSADSTSYIAMEFVDGTSLRELLAAGSLPTKKMLDIAVQIAEGLAKAHGAGIVHRDLKPENVMVSKDGFVKLLDFGLAKLFAAPQEQVSGMPTMVHQETQPGTVMGTVGYMSPEQASGRPVDFRSDQFALGSILYEMATGRRAFQRGTGAQTLAAIIQDEPEPVAQLNPRAPAPFRWIVERCFAKDPDERYASTRDLARDLKSVREHITEAVSSGGTAVVEPASRRSRILPRIALGIALLAAGLGAGIVLDRRTNKAEPPSFHQLTFRRGTIFSARFAPDGQTVMYSAAWDGKPMEIFVGRPESPESRPFGLSGAEVLAIAKSGEMAVSLNRTSSGAFRRSGTLAQLSVAGGAAPRDILKEIEWADWAPDGKTLAIVKTLPGKMRIEYPVGKAVYETSGWVSHLRISPDGELVGFVDHPTPGDDGGSIAAVDRTGRRIKLSEPFASAQGLAWSSSGEIWFTATEVGGNRALYSTTRSGRVRLRVRTPGSLTLQDISREGRLLVTRETLRSEMVALAPGESKERDLTWLDWSLPAAISADGRTVLFSESGEGGGAGYSVYVRKTDGSPAVRLGEGNAQDLSPDGEWALAIVHSASDPQLAAYPTGAGEPKVFPKEGLSVFGASFLPDGKQILLTASEPGHGTRLYLRDVAGGKPRALTPEGYVGLGVVAPDGKWALVTGPDRRRYLYPLSGGEPTAVPGLDSEAAVHQRSADGRFLYVNRRGEAPANVYRLDLSNGQNELWRTLMPSDAAGVWTITSNPTPDGKSYVYNYPRTLSDLYLVDGLK
jgi:serine/threonine protein kinase/Tol biopolymer transport system component